MIAPVLTDTTLREGDQTPGIAFSAGEKVRLAEMLLRMGIREIEAGTAAMGGSEKESIQEIVRLKNSFFHDVTESSSVRILGWNRTVESDLAASIEAGLDSVYVSSPVSDFQILNFLGKNRDYVLAALRDSIISARLAGLYTAVGLQDSSRADPDFIVKTVLLAKENGADRVRLSDTLGKFTPARISELIKRIKNHPELKDFPLEVHCHDDFGRAGANTLAAWEAGAEYLNGTVIGLGERAGNAPLEQLALALSELYHIETGIDFRMLSPVADYIKSVSGIYTPPHQPVIGPNIFSHESGVHVSGVYKNPENYEPFPPEKLGKVRTIVLGKHSSRLTLKKKLDQLGIGADQADDAALDTLLLKVRVYAEEHRSDGVDLMIREFFSV